MTEKPPMLQPPIAISGNGSPSDLAPMVVEACRKSGPVIGALGGAMLGAVAAYFVPKLLDRALGGDPHHGEPVELDVQDDDDEA